MAAGTAQLVAALVVGGVSAVGSIVTGITSSIKSQADIDKAIQEIDAIGLPDEKKLQVKQDLLKYIGDYKPDVLVGTAYEGIVEDIRLRDAQMDALKGMRDRSTSGMSAQAKSDLASINAQSGQLAKQGRDANAQAMAARGMGGSGLAQAGNLLANQAGANANFQQGLGVASADEAARTAALRDMATIGGNVRNQDYLVASNKASALDKIKEFNINNSNQAQLRNLNQQQDINNQNSQIGANNQQNKVNAYLRSLGDTRQNVFDKLKLRQAKTGSEAGMWGDVWGTGSDVSKGLYSWGQGS